MSSPNAFYEGVGSIFLDYFQSPGILVIPSITQYYLSTLFSLMQQTTSLSLSSLPFTVPANRLPNIKTCPLLESLLWLPKPSLPVYKPGQKCWGINGPQEQSLIVDCKQLVHNTQLSPFRGNNHMGLSYYGSLFNNVVPFWLPYLFSIISPLLCSCLLGSLPK